MPPRMNNLAPLARVCRIAGPAAPRKTALPTTSLTWQKRREYATPAAASEKVNGIVDSIAGLTLLETAELISALKTRLNISEIAMPVAAVPVAAAAPAAPAAPAEAAAPAEKAPEKASFTIKLESFAADAKAKVIREIKNIVPGINLVDAKKFAESVPKVMREDVPKAEAEKIKKTLEELGAKVVLE